MGSGRRHRQPAALAAERQTVQVGHRLAAAVERDLLISKRGIPLHRQFRQPVVDDPAAVDVLLRHGEVAADVVGAQDRGAVGCEGQAAEVEGVADAALPLRFIRPQVPAADLAGTAARRGEMPAVRRQGEVARLARGRPAAADLAAGHVNLHHLIGPRDGGEQRLAVRGEEQAARQRSDFHLCPRLQRRAGDVEEGDGAGPEVADRGMFAIRRADDGGRPVAAALLGQHLARIQVD